MTTLAPTRPTSQTPPPMRRVAAKPPTKKVWTCDEFHRLGDMDVFEGLRPMFIHGEIWEQGDINPPHAVAGVKTEEVVSEKFGRVKWHRRSQKPLVFGLSIDPLPDLAVMTGRPQDYSGHPNTAALVVRFRIPL